MSTDKLSRDVSHTGPRLDVRAPVTFGVAVIAAFFGVGLTVAALAPIDKGVGLPGTIIVETRTKPVQHERGGTVARIHVAEGEEVETGQLLISLDTQSLDEQVAALQAQAQASARQLDLARQEAATMAELQGRQLAARSKVLALERQVAEIEKEEASLAARIAVAVQERARAEVRAPVSGRVMQLRIAGPGAVVQAGAALLDLVPKEDRLVVEGRLAPNQIENVKPGMPAKVWLAGLSWREQRPLEARLAWVSADSVEDKRTGQPYFVARVELDEPRAAIAERMALQAGMRSEVLLMTGQRTLLDQLLDPLMKNVKRAFRG